jgi:hypothetical protein
VVFLDDDHHVVDGIMRFHELLRTSDGFPTQYCILRELIVASPYRLSSPHPRNGVRRFLILVCAHECPVHAKHEWGFSLLRDFSASQRLSVSALYCSSIFDLPYRCVGAQFLRVVRRRCGERAKSWCFLLFHGFPHSFESALLASRWFLSGPPLPQTLSLGQLEPHRLK